MVRASGAGGVTAGASPWWAPLQPLCIAHQGGALESPSSTLFAFASAQANGADVFELDVHATAEGVLVVLHDEVVDRCTDGRGRVDTLTLDQIRRLDAAYWFRPGAGMVLDGSPDDYPLRGVATGHRPPPEGFEPDDFKVPTLEDVLERFPGVPVNIDIKQTAPDTRPYEAALAELLRRTGRIDDVMVASFHDAALAQFRLLAPEVATSAGPDEVLALWTSVAEKTPLDGVAYRALQVPESFDDVTVVSPDLVAGAHDLGLAVHVWTVNDEAAMARLLDMGVDGIVSDRPTLLRSVLDARFLVN